MAVRGTQVFSTSSMSGRTMSISLDGPANALSVCRDGSQQVRPRQAPGGPIAVPAWRRGPVPTPHQSPSRHPASRAPHASVKMAGSDRAPAAAPKMAASRYVADGPSKTAMASRFLHEGTLRDPPKGALLVSTRQRFLRSSRRRGRGDQHHKVEQNCVERIDLLRHPPPVVCGQRRRRLDSDVLAQRLGRASRVCSNWVHSSGSVGLG
ncbi:unnamed protein product [Lampetra planeri]